MTAAAAAAFAAPAVGDCEPASHAGVLLACRNELICCLVVTEAAGVTARTEQTAAAVTVAGGGCNLKGRLRRPSGSFVAAAVAAVWPAFPGVCAALTCIGSFPLFCLV